MYDAVDYITGGLVLYSVVRYKSIKAHCIVLVERMTRRTDFGPLTRTVCHWQIEHALIRKHIRDAEMCVLEILICFQH